MRHAISAHVLALSCLVQVPAAVAAHAETNVVDVDRQGERSPIPIGMWQQFWDVEHRNLDLYVALQPRLAEKKQEEIVGLLIRYQKEQTAILQAMFKAVATEGRRLERFGQYPPVPQKPSELIAEAQDFEQRFLGDYRTLPSEFAGTPLQRSAERLVTIQEKELTLLSELKAMIR